MGGNALADSISGKRDVCQGWRVSTIHGYISLLLDIQPTLLLAIIIYDSIQKSTQNGR
jgi:hypothetical protein